MVGRHRRGEAAEAEAVGRRRREDRRGEAEEEAVDLRRRGEEAEEEAGAD